MADEILIDKVHELSDLELATLTCLVAQEHCIIDTDPEVLDELVNELQLVASKIFGLSHAVIDCSEHTSLDDFAHALLSVEGTPTHNSPARPRTEYFLPTPAFTSINRSPVAEGFTDNKTIANVIIAKNIDEAPKQVQIQALELMRTKRIYTRTSVQTAPKRFLFICLLAGGEGPRLTKHLNDYMFISHFHDPDDGFPNLEDIYDDGKSISSVVKKSPTTLDPDDVMEPRIAAADIDRLTQLSDQVTVSVDVKQYQQNVVSYLRLHRAVAAGISAVATKNFDKLTKCLAPLQGLSYVTPSLVAIAARKIYMHRIRIVTPDRDRSMQWGSDLDAVTALLEGIGAEDVIEDVLGTMGAEAPL